MAVSHRHRDVDPVIEVMGGDSPNPTQLYRRHHVRTLLTLRALRRVLADSPGTKVPSHVFDALAVLLALPLGRYDLLHLHPWAPALRFLRVCVT